MTPTDTGPLVALLDRKDPYNARCREALPQLSLPLVTTHACLTEAFYLLAQSGGAKAQEDLWRLIRDGDVLVQEMGELGLVQIDFYMTQYQTVPCDFADATLLALCEQIGASVAFSLDGHFYTYRLDNGDYLNVIPGPPR